MKWRVRRRGGGSTRGTSAGVGAGIALWLAACGSDGSAREGAAGSAPDDPGIGGSGSGMGTAGNGPGAPNGSSGSGPSTSPLPLEPGNDVELSVSPVVLDPILAELERARALDAAGLAAERAVPFQPALGYDPRAALGFEPIRAHFGLSQAALDRFAENGFLILPGSQYASFPYGYFDIYGADLPVYVTADMVLEAVHRSFDDILAFVERSDLSPRLARLLTAMRARLAAGALAGEVAQDADFYVSVALGLLTDEAATSATGLDLERVRTFVSKAKQASGSEVMTIFGTQREIDFSQFTLRGHYAGDPALEPYFRAMMWLGRVDLRLIETQPSGERVFWRRQLEAALGLGALLDEGSRRDWDAIDRVIGAFVGEHDSMTVPELDQLLAALGTTREAGLGERSDAEIAQAIVDGQYGAQRIASHIIRRQPGPDGALPLNASFAFFGQRYTVDSHVFSNVVYDRVQTRVLPNPLDAAFAALGNDHAVALLSSELEQRPYAGALASMRALVDAHPSEYWQSSLYTSWLDALRTLSPRAEGGAAGTAASVDAAGLPAVARREPWARRLLSSQLASWAQLRHDTLLYAKQSYTAGSICEFPDAYVEPYPEFFHAIARFSELGLSIASELAVGTDPEDFAQSATRVTNYFTGVRRVALLLANMAELQRSGMPHTEAQVAFINQAVRIEAGGSGPPFHDGWYRELFFDPTAALELDPTIADVHTDPGGDTPFGREASVLHVGTGMPRAMLVSIDTCVGPRAYAGVVFSYHEHLESGLVRLDDEAWSLRLQTMPPADVPWLAPVTPAP
jgi:hypothetical protein